MKLDITDVESSSEQQFQAIIEYCDDTKELVETRCLSHSNGAHTIDTVTCEWEIIENEN